MQNAQGVSRPFTSIRDSFATSSRVHADPPQSSAKAHPKVGEETLADNSSTTREGGGVGERRAEDVTPVGEDRLWGFTAVTEAVPQPLTERRIASRDSAGETWWMVPILNDVRII